ncbi:putative Ig domain-containing protein [Candidatus Parcubacteria bacterium]|nr:putative Ig domain-containing protein [Candidatus Parcubacteria bacterium]
MHKLLTKKLITCFSLGIALVFLVFQSNVTLSQAQSPDAIAIRVIPNDNHWSPQRWYREQDFSGSPQSIIVDGYDGVRDGRTVYVNAANIVAGELFTNIYLISYNQDAEQPTIDILGQILKHWKFNTNVIGVGSCYSDTSRACLLDSDCARGDYCLSDKAGIIRDVKRLQDLADIETQVIAYYNENSKYPSLSSGSYLKNQTLSVWPSWQKVLAQYLGGNLPIDPINALAECPDNYHSVTCWDEVDKRFDDQNTNTADIDLRAGSEVYKYISNDNGDSYYVCAVMESGYVSDIGDGACPESNTYDIQDIAGNNPPYFSGINLPTAISGEPYEGAIEVIDPDSDRLTWNYTPGGGWASPVEMRVSSDDKQRIFYSDNAGASTYSFTLDITDNRGGNISRVFTIPVFSLDTPNINAISDQSVVIGHDLSFTISANEPNSEYPLNYHFNGHPQGFNSGGSLSGNQYDYNISGIVNDQTGSYFVTLIVTDTNGDEAAVTFSVNIVNNPPQISSTPVTSAIGCVSEYIYQIVASDTDGHALSYAAEGLPAGLSINTGNGLISGVPRVPSATFPVRVNVRDQFYAQTTVKTDAEAIQIFNLNINDESFSVSLSSVYDFFATPIGVDPFSLYYAPFPFFAQASTDTASPVTWAISTDPDPPTIPDLSVLINPAVGSINISAFNNNIAASGYSFSNTVSATTHDCNVGGDMSFSLTAYPNEWCGDAIIQSGFGELCDGADLNGEDCVSLGFSGGSPLLCDNSCDFNTDNCCNHACAGRECGPDPVECIGDCPPGCGPNAHCETTGQCLCDPGYTACDNDMTDANGCECYTGGDYACVGTICIEYCVFGSSLFNNCIIQ